MLPQNLDDKSFFLLMPSTLNGFNLPTVLQKYIPKNKNLVVINVTLSDCRYGQLKLLKRQNNVYTH